MEEVLRKKKKKNGEKLGKQRDGGIVVGAKNNAPR